jgi:hypothetical protein
MGGVVEREGPEPLWSIGAVPCAAKRKRHEFVSEANGFGGFQSASLARTIIIYQIKHLCNSDSQQKE